MFVSVIKKECEATIFGKAKIRLFQEFLTRVIHTDFFEFTKNKQEKKYKIVIFYRSKKSTMRYFQKMF